MMRVLEFGLGALLLLVTCAGAKATVSFSAAPVEPVADGNPLGIAAADVNRDGFVDLVIANTDLDSVTVLMGKGDGSFVEPGATYGLADSAGPAYVGLADFNNDGSPDIITANQNDDTVAVLLNQGNGVFDAPIGMSVGVAPIAVVTGDLNGDGKLDAVTADSYGDTITVLLGTGSASLTPQDPISVGTGPSSLAVADFDGDGKLDLAVTNSAGGDAFVGSVSILKGAGNGTFTAVSEMAPADLQTPVWLGAADFNHDGKQDIAVLNQDLDDVSVFLGNGDLSFAAPLSAPVSSVPNACALADYDGDGNMDIACSGEFDDKVGVLTGLGDGSFAPLVEFDVGSFPYAVVTADFNGDKKPDLATTNLDAGTSTILLNTTGSTPSCGGDCDGSREVTIDELIKMVNIALGTLPISQCTPGDTNMDGEITIDEIIVGVNHALNGCA